MKYSYNEVQLARSLRLRLGSSLALTAENWEPCVHITPGMVRANGKAQAKAVSASLWDLPLHTQNRCTACYSRLVYTEYNGLIRQCA